MTSLTVKTGGFLNLGIGLPAVISLIRNVKDQPEPVSTINRNRVKHQPKAKSQTSAEGIHDSRAGEGTRTPNHLFTRSRRNVQGCASTPGVWHNGPRKALEVPLRCCQGCCQPGHDHLQPLAASCLGRGSQTADSSQRFRGCGTGPTVTTRTGFLQIARRYRSRCSHGAPANGLPGFPMTARVSAMAAVRMDSRSDCVEAEPCLALRP